MHKIALVLILFFIGCSTKTTPIYAVIKTPKIKLSDQGFLKKGFGYKKVVIYKGGLKPFEITIKNSFVCIENRCMDKNTFVKEYVGSNYPPDFFDKILNKECVKGFFCKKGKNFILIKNKKDLFLIKFLKERG